MSTHDLTKMQIKRIEKEIRDTPLHKATEHHIGRLRAKLSKLRDRLDNPTTNGGGGGYAIKKQGDATVVLVGPPSAGKSTLLNRLTNAKSKVAPYEFTTLTVIPGMMEYKKAKIQILDVPGLIEDAEEGKGIGREVLSVARGADLIILITDIDRIKRLRVIKKTLYQNGIRLNQKPPQVDIEKKVSGGIIIHTNIKQDISKETIKSVALDMGIKNAEITIKEKLDWERLIDAFNPNRVYVPGFEVINKIDLKKKSGRGNYLKISAEKNIGLDDLREKIWQSLQLVTVFLVHPQEKPNHNHPIIMKEGQTLANVAKKIGEEFSQEKTRAKIWGKHAKFPSQEVSLATPVKEGLQVRFI